MRLPCCKVRGGFVRDRVREKRDPRGYQVTYGTYEKCGYQDVFLLMAVAKSPKNILIAAFFVSPDLFL